MRGSESGEALIIVDVQQDFLPGGALGVPDGDKIFPAIMDFAAQTVEHVALTRDWHPPNHISFSDEPEYKDYSWPPHCVQSTFGAGIDDRIQSRFPDAPIFSKGDNPQYEAYSGFDGYGPNDQTLLEWLTELDVRYVYICGLATDYCVKETALDAASYDFSTVVLTEGTRGVSYGTTVRAIQEMVDAGVTFT